MYICIQVYTLTHNVRRILTATDCSRCWVQAIQRVDFLSEHYWLPWLCKFIEFRGIPIPRKYSPLVNEYYRNTHTYTYKELTQTNHRNIFIPLPHPSTANFTSPHTNFLSVLWIKYISLNMSVSDYREKWDRHFYEHHLPL